MAMDFYMPRVCAVDFHGPMLVKFLFFTPAAYLYSRVRSDT